jgi:hypothetical protein
LAFTVFLIWKFELFAPFLVATIAAKDMSTCHCPPLAMALMNDFPMFNSVCLCLSKAEINSYLIPYWCHIFCCSFLSICIDTFCNVIYIFLFIVTPDEGPYIIIFSVKWKHVFISYLFKLSAGNEFCLDNDFLWKRILKTD